MPRFLTVCGIVALTGSAAAQSPRYTRPQPAPTAAPLSDRVRPIQPKPPDPTPHPMVVDVESVLATPKTNPRPEQEQILIGLIQETPDSEIEEKSDYYFRLGEVYAAQQRFWRKRSAELAGDPKQSAAAAMKAKDYLLKAVKTFKALTDNDAFRNYPKLDEALFSYGFTLQSGKYMKEARAVYDKLLKNFPNSAYVPDAHLVFAEYYFEANQLADAEARYKVVLKFPTSPAYAYAMYKLGYIHMALQRYQEALETFFQTVQLTANDRKAAGLNEAAKQGFVDAYAQIGKPDKAPAAFARVDAAHAAEMVGVLADRYLAEGKSDGAISLYREMIKQAPASNEVCRWQYNVAHAMLSFPGATAADRVQEIENLVKLYTVVKATLPPAEAQECRENAAAMASEIGRSYYADPAKSPESLGYAGRLYKAYGDAFPEVADAGYAEVMWSRAATEPNPRLQPERWAQAAHAFTALGRASDAVLAWKNALDVDPRPSVQAGAIDLLASSRTKVTVRPIPAREQAALVALQTYRATLTDPDETARTLFLEATIDRRFGHDEDALPLLAQLLDQHRAHETAELAANAMLDSLVRLQRLDDVLQLVDKLAADARFLDGKPTLQANIKLLRSRSLRR
jgi:tetratricopeptide (TPR) repeat protein